jgi:hypothetical protein
MLAVAALTAWHTTDASSGVDDWIANLFLFTMSGIPTALGLWLAHRGEQGIIRRLTRDLATAAASLRSPRQLGRSLQTPFGLAAAVFAVGVLLMLTAREKALVTAMIMLTIYSIVDPILNLWRRSWWGGALLSGGAWVMLLTLFGLVAEGIARLGEGSLVFLLPMMVFAGTMLASGAVKMLLFIATPRTPPVSSSSPQKMHER